MEQSMRMNRVMTLALMGAGALTLSACGHARDALGLAKVTPDEFRIVTKAPLVLPPDYALRPPAPGEPRPQELQPESAARQALLGQRDAEARSEGEKLFVQKAGGERADPLARYVVDDEFGDIAYKEKGFADRVMFWKRGQVPPEVVAENQSAPVDVAAEEARLQSLTGGKTIVIQKKSSRRKLPGL
jgi:hypothetical protein